MKTRPCSPQVFAMVGILFGLTFLVAGCAMPRCLKPGKAYWAKHTRKGVKGQVGGSYNTNGEKPPLVLNEKAIRERCAVAVTNGRVQVSSSIELQAHGEVIAQLTERALAPLDALTGLPVSNRLHLYYLYLPEEKRVIQFSLPTSFGSDSFPWLAPVTNKLANTGAVHLTASQVLADLKGSPMTLWLLTHELYEANLINPQGMKVMPDITGSLGCLSWTLKYGTRWFREGFASYAGYHAARNFRNHAARIGECADQTRMRGLDFQPFSKLAKVKTDLFRWNQNSKAALNTDYYEATLGLFLLIEQRHGSGAIKVVAEALPDSSRPDGPSILKLFQEKVGLDLRRMVRDFVFPDLGLAVKTNDSDELAVQSVRPGGRASEVGLRAGDLILTVNNRPVVDLLDYELQILRAYLDGQPIAIHFMRDGKSETRLFILR